MKLCIAVLALSACGAEQPEQKLTEVAEDVAAARSEVVHARHQIDAARASLAERRQAVEDAEQALAEAREELNALKLELADRQQELDRFATDAALFRLVQSRLLQDEALASDAIACSVSDGTVTLHGEVGSTDSRQRAEILARTTPGVDAVRNLIVVVGEDRHAEIG